jgi:hypothetical protein
MLLELLHKDEAEIAKVGLKGSSKRMRQVWPLIISTNPLVMVSSRRCRMVLVN